MYPDDLKLTWDLEYDCVYVDADGNEHKITMETHGLSVEIIPNKVKPMFKRF